MKKILLTFMVAVFVLSASSAVFAGQSKKEKPGPAPNSGDGIPDGSGF